MGEYADSSWVFGTRITTYETLALEIYLFRGGVDNSDKNEDWLVR